MPRKPTLVTMSWDATTERLAKAANDNDVITTADENGAPVVTRRVTDWPLARLRNRGLLDADSETNAKLFDAGERYFADWYSAGLAPLGAIDYGREHVDGGTLAGLNVSEFRIAALERFRRAGKAMGDCAGVVDAVVLRGETATAVGLFESGSAREATGRSYGMRKLRVGLNRLAERYGLISNAEIAA